MTELIDKMKLLEQIAEFGREIPKDQVIGVIARQEAVETEGDVIRRADAIDALGDGAMVNYQATGHDNGLVKAIDIIKGLPSAQPEEVIPHRNYKYLSDYWCECGWHLGKKGDVKYCAECGRKVNWNG